MKNKNSGFTLLFAVLVSSITLVVGIGIIDVVLKQIELSGIGRESQMAFYAADSGVECALYWDVKQKVLSETDPPVVTPTCLGASVANLTFAGGVTTFETTLQNGSCASVTVAKIASSTTVLARGMSVACNADSSRKVERALEAAY